jgi:signal transduction histidine kinase
MAGLAAAIERMASSVERRQQDLHEQVASRTEQLRHADRLGGLGKIAAALAHEIGNPLGSIGLCIEGLKRSLAEGRIDDAEVRRYLETVRGEIERCTAITRRMLGYARYRATPTEDVEVATVLRHGLDLVAGHARRARVKVVLDDRTNGARIHGDVPQLQQVVVNLLLNAVDASAAGQEVRLTAERSGDEVAVRVIDHGAGVAPADRENVFLPFYTTKRPGEGTGLGLAISREIIEAHGGRLGVRDSDGPGATFEAALPVARNGA